LVFGVNGIKGLRLQRIYIQIVALINFVHAADLIAVLF